MNKSLFSLVLAVIIIGGGVFLYQKHESDPYDSDTGTSTPVVYNTTATSAPVNVATSTATSTSVTNADIKIVNPTKGQSVSSPLVLTGQARGNWFFEASAPVYLVDASGKKIAQGTIHATGDWMTTNFVPFTGTLTWTASSTGTSTQGTVVFMNDNPSGNPSLQKSVSVPIVFKK